MSQRAKTNAALIVCAPAYMSIYIARMNLSMASPALRQMHYLSTSQLGILGSVFSVVYALGRLFSGAISDVTPPYRMITTGLILAGVGNILFSLFPPFVGAVLLWGLNALAQSMLWSSVLVIASYGVERKRAARRASYLAASVSAGNILGIVLNLFFIDRFGVRFAFVIPGAITLLLSAAVFLSARHVPAKDAADAASAAGILRRTAELFHNREILTALTPAAFHGVIRDSVTIWMALFFTERYGIDISTFAGQLLFIPAAGFVGRLLYPLVSKLFHDREHRVSQAAFVLSLAVSALLVVRGISPMVAMLCLAGAYTAASIANTSFASVFPLRFTRHAASVSGLMDFVTYLGAGAASLVYGFLIERAGYDVMFLSWCVLSLASIAILERLILLQHHREVREG